MMSSDVMRKRIHTSSKTKWLVPAFYAQGWPKSVVILPFLKFHMHLNLYNKINSSSPSQIKNTQQKYDSRKAEE